MKRKGRGNRQKARGRKARGRQARGRKARCTKARGGGGGAEGDPSFYASRVRPTEHVMCYHAGAQPIAGRTWKKKIDRMAWAGIEPRVSLLKV